MAPTRVQRLLSRYYTAFLLRRKGGRLSALVNARVSSWRHSKKVVIPLLGGIGFDNLVVSESWMDLILPVLAERKPGAFVDVGANIGQTLLKVKLLAPDQEYFGFEPNPACFTYTRSLVALNGFERCTLIPVGLSNTTGVLSLFGRSQADVSGSVVAGFRSQSRSPRLMHVAVFEGDQLFESLGSPPIGTLKIDVEGGEVEVLEGLRSMIRRHRPFILCEILPLFSLTSRLGQFRAPRQQRLLSGMRESGYVMYRIHHDATAQPLDDVECHSDMSLTNYLFAPVEEREYIDARLAQGPRQQAVG